MDRRVADGRAVRPGHWATALLVGLCLAPGCVEDVARDVSADGSLINATARSTAAISTPDPSPRFETGKVFESIDGFIGHHAPTIAALGDGELIAAWYAYTGPHELDGSRIMMARLPVGAAEWTAPALIVDTPRGDGNPVLYAEGDEVWLARALIPFGWSTASAVVQHSRDRGQTWSRATPLPGPLGTNVKHPPIRVRDGGLLLPASDDLLQRSLFFYSADGETWTLRSSLETLPPFRAMQPSLVALDDGRVLGVFRNVGTGWLWASASDDSGRTWTTPTSSNFPNPGSPAAMLRTRSGNLVLVFNDTNAERVSIAIALSPDAGATWTAPRQIVSAPGQQAYPAIVEGADGVLHVVYSHARDWIGHLRVNEAWIAAGE